MTIRLLLVISLTALLFGCSSDKVKDDAPAAVEDLTSQQANTGGTEDSNAQAYGTDDSSTSGFSQLDDPQSPLSVRVIYFEYDSSEIRSEYRSAIEAHAAYLSQNADTTITLEGHADERGSREYNLALGERRADAARDYLVSLGIDPNRIKIVSFGKERPAVPGSNENAWAQNRRAVLVLAK